MKYIILICIVCFFAGCKKTNTPISTCNIQQVYVDNNNKVTISNGIWGTVSFMEGDCMPMIGPGISSCRNCPVKRTVRIYNYTLQNQAAYTGFPTGFYDSFSTALVKELVTDDNGFFQTDLPAGKYTMVVIENGKLYANAIDGQGGINPFTFSGGLKNINLALTYKAVF